MTKHEQHNWRIFLKRQVTRLSYEKPPEVRKPSGTSMRLLGITRCSAIRMQHSHRWKKHFPTGLNFSYSRLTRASTICAPIRATPICFVGWGCRSKRPRHPHPEGSQSRVREVTVAGTNPSFWRREDYDSHTLRRFNEAPHAVPKSVLSGTLRRDVFGRCDRVA